jgi:hypothetical protein
MSEPRPEKPRAEDAKASVVSREPRPEKPQAEDAKASVVK